MTNHLQKLLRNPPREAMPMFRYWFPANCDLDLHAIRKDMQEICEKGFGGAELKCEGAANDIVELGTPRWQAAMTAAMKTLRDNGCRGDFGNTAGQFIVCPEIRSVEDPRAAQELDFSALSVPEGNRGCRYTKVELPPQATPMKGPDVRTKATLVCVTAASPLPDGTLDAASMCTIPATISGDTVEFQIPDDRPWLVFFHWKRARNETQATLLADGGVALLPLLDFYSKEASITFIRYWLDVLMTPEMLKLGQEMHSYMFSDNVENSWQRQAQWSDSEEIFSRFRQAHGYELAPYLPLLYRDGGGFIPESEPLYTSSEAGLGERVHQDYCQIMTQLYMEHHLMPVRDALNRAGMGLRIQTPYGSLRQEQTLPATCADIPETESLWMGDSIDGYRAAAGAVHMSGKKLYSSETGAVMGQANRQTWLELLHQVERSVMGGVNLSVLHGFGYSGRKEDSFWPGWSCMAPQFSNDWGPRTPQWIHAEAASGYMSRIQTIAQWGEPAVDLAVMRLRYKTPRNPGASARDGMFDSDCLRDAGYTYEYVSPGLIAAYPDRFCYKALVVSPEQAVLPDVQTAIRDLEARGIPVLCYDTPETVADSLCAMGILPRTVLELRSGNLYTLCRTQRNETAYLICNTGNEEAAGEIIFAEKKAGHILDLWTGADSHQYGQLEGNLFSFRIPPQSMCAVIFDGTAQPRQRKNHKRIVPDTWLLTLTEYLPGENPETSQLKTSVHRLPALMPWSLLPGMEAASGIGVYEAEFTLEESADGACLCLGPVSEIFDVTLNGKTVPCSPGTGTADLTEALRPGKNLLSVRTSSALYNRLTEVYPEKYGKMPAFGGGFVEIPRQIYGIKTAEVHTTWCSGNRNVHA